MGLWGVLTSKPAQVLVEVAVRVAGRWAADKALELGQAAVDTAKTAANAVVDTTKAVANAVDHAARDAVRETIHRGADKGSDLVGAVSETYQGAKGAAVAGAKQIGKAVNSIAKTFGMDPPVSIAEPCPACEALGEAPDGSLMVPSEACPADAIPVSPGGTAAALSKAKAASRASTKKCCESKPDSEKNRMIIYVNGINTTPDRHCKTLKMLQDMTCGKVIGVLNRSEGAVTDIVRTNDARQRIKREIGNAPASDYAGFTPAVKTMKDVMTLQAVEGGQTTVFAHSEGGAITSLAAIRAKAALAKGNRPEAIGNLNIVSMGAAAPAWPDGPSYTHYIHVQDIVPNAVGLGDSASRPGNGAKMVYFGGRDGQYENIGPGDKKPYLPITPKINIIADHFADYSYLPYINQQGGGCLDQP